MKKEKGFNIEEFIECPDVIILKDDSESLKEIKNSYLRLKDRVITHLNPQCAEAVKNRIYNAGRVAIDSGLMPHTEEYCLKMTAILLAQEEIRDIQKGKSINEAARKSYSLILDSGAFYTNDQLSYINSHIQRAIELSNEKSSLTKKLCSD
jgi:hypothetical protein